MADHPNQPFLTQDGSYSLISGKFGEAYHSRYGALEESNHVFIEAGLNYQIHSDKPALNILEIGFGTGLNAILTFKFAQNKPKAIHYATLEAYPITLEEAKMLDYPELLDVKANEFLQFHTHEWGQEVGLTETFSFVKHKIEFEDFESDVDYDLIYFDAFAPSIQAHLWEVPFLDKIYKMCSKNAVLVTYCAKGSFKRALKQCGFALESLPGPAKKREMTRAIKV